MWRQYKFLPVTQSPVDNPGAFSSDSKSYFAGGRDCSVLKKPSTKEVRKTVVVKPESPKTPVVKSPDTPVVESPKKPVVAPVSPAENKPVVVDKSEEVDSKPSKAGAGRCFYSFALLLSIFAFYKLD